MGKNHKLSLRMNSKICSIYTYCKEKIQYSLICRETRLPFVYSRVVTSEMIKAGGKSIVRFGDGELAMVLDHVNLGFQKYDQELAEKLLHILQSPPDNRILVCLPNVFVTLGNMKEQPASYWRSWVIKYGKRIPFICDVEYRYGDAFISRLYLAWKNKSKEEEILNNLKYCWHQREVILVEGSKTRWGVGNDLLLEAKSIKRILCPSENAFSAYRQILDSCKRFGTKESVFIIALGPTATVLAYDLAKEGYYALDLGHFDLQYEYMLRRTDKREIISNKYNNEIMNGDSVGEYRADDYYLSIVDTISL